MDSIELLKSISKSFFENDNEHIMYFSLSENLIDTYKSFVKPDELLLDLKEKIAPLAPFLDVIKSTDVSEADIKKHVYKLHYDFFSSYFNGCFVEERKEPVVFEELDYEKSRIRESIIKLLNEKFSGKVVVLNAQLMGEDAFRILHCLNENQCPGKFVFCFNSMELDNYSLSVRNFINCISGYNNYYSINSFEISEKIPQKADVPKKYSPEFLREILRSYRLFFDLEQALKLVNEIDENQLLCDFEINDIRKINFEMGIISLFSNDTDNASLYFNKVIENVLDDELTCYTLYLMAKVELLKNIKSVALKHVNRALIIAKEKNNSSIYALLETLNYNLSECLDSECSVKKYFEAIKLLDREGFVNNKIHTILTIPRDVIYDSDLRPKMIGQIEMARQEAEKLDNKFALSTACHWMGIIMTHEGKKNEALFWYENCLHLRKELGESVSITKITNGLAYNNLLDSKYQISYDLINNTIQNLLETHDYPEIVITLNNLARTCFYAKNFDIASKIFRTILNLFTIFDIANLSGNSFLPEYNDIAVYVAAVDYYKGEINRAKMNLYNVHNNGKKIGVIEKYIGTFLSACIELDDGKPDVAMQVMDEGIQDFLNEKINQEHQLVFMIYEFALCLLKNNFEAEAKKYFNDGYKIAKKKDLVHYTLGRDVIELEDYSRNILRFAPLNISLELLEEKAEKEKLINKLHKRLRDSQFLNRLVSTSATTTADVKFSGNIAQALFDYTMADAIYLGQKCQGEWIIDRSLLRVQFEEPAEDLWHKVARQKQLVNFIDFSNDYICAMINLSKFDYIGGIIIFIQKKNELSSEEKNILHVAASNIQAQFIMLKQNEYLSQISVTDQLSSLNNRRALQEHLSMESELIRRYEKKKHLYMREAISFLDLDNFKYYNDTFGHEAGDLLISCFARLLKRIYRRVDFVARFGGDEFVVMLPNTSCEEARRAAERLKEGLEQEQYFIPCLERHFEKEIFIPREKYIDFSMGICSNADNEDTSDLDETMTRADQALYYAKQHKKGSVVIWNEVEELKDE